MGMGKGKVTKEYLTRRFEWVLVTSFSNSFLLFFPAHQAHTEPQDICGEGQLASVSLAASRVSP